MTLIDSVSDIPCKNGFARVLFFFSIWLSKSDKIVIIYHFFFICCDSILFVKRGRKNDFCLILIIPCISLQIFINSCCLFKGFVVAFLIRSINFVLYFMKFALVFFTRQTYCIICFYYLFAMIAGVIQVIDC